MDRKSHGDQHALIQSLERNSGRFEIVFLKVRSEMGTIPFLLKGERNRQGLHGFSITAWISLVLEVTEYNYNIVLIVQKNTKTTFNTQNIEVFENSNLSSFFGKEILDFHAFIHCYNLFLKSERSVDCSPLKILPQNSDNS